MSRKSDTEDGKSKLSFEHVADNSQVLANNVNAKYVFDPLPSPPPRATSMPSFNVRYNTLQDI